MPKAPKNKPSTKDRRTGHISRSSTNSENTSTSNRDMMRPITAQISASKVKATWPTISESGQADIVQLLRDVSLPVMHAIRGEKKRVEFQGMLGKMITKAQKKISKVPVPPSTRETHYKYDRLVAQRDQLEAALLPLLEQIPLIEAEIATEEARLEEDAAYLEELKRNAKQQKTVTLSSASQKTAERLIEKHKSTLHDSAEEINYKPNNFSSGGSSNRDLESHVNKMLENTQHIRQLLDSCELLTEKVGASSAARCE